MIIALIFSVLFLFYSRNKMMKGYEVKQTEEYDDLAPETCVKR